MVLKKIFKVKTKPNKKIILNSQSKLTEFLNYNYGIKDLNKFIDILEKQNSTRADNIEVSNNSKTKNINPQTGEVLAIVGGADYEKSKFNRAIQSKRSVGSSIKPFIYQIALNIGYNPASLIPDIARTFKIPSDTPQEEKYWKPTNYEKTH